MALHIVIELEILSDFHIGTGTGLGSVVDAAVRRDRRGCPVIPGSSLKGLTRDEAVRLCAAHANLGHDGTLLRLFGHRKNSQTAVQGAVHFGNAVPAEPWHPPRVHGRSARDRRTGRALEDHLFHIQDAAAGRFRAEIHATEEIDDRAIVLLLASLRRIEALGGQRRRGKGHVSVHVEVRDGPPGWTGVRIPENPRRFEQTLRALLAGQPLPPNPSQSETGGPPARATVEATRREAVPQEEWSTLIVIALAENALVLTAQPDAGNVTASLAHIPGGTARGAFAAWLLRHGWNPHAALFTDSLVREGLHFGPLYPCPALRGGALTVPLPAPRAFLTCKIHPGLLGSGDAHGAADLLATSAITLCGQPGCGAPLVPLGGYLMAESVGGYDEKRLHHVTPATHVHQHVALDPETQRAAEGDLFSLEGVPEGSWFAGYIWGRRQLLDALRQAISGAASGVVLTVGRARTRGYGTLRVVLQRDEPQAHAVYPWLLASTATAGTPVSPDAPAEAASDASRGFTLTLYSDLIALDELLRPVTRLDETKFWQLLGGTTSEPPFRLVRGYASSRPIAGFNGVPGRPRTVDVALMAGSTWLFEWTATGDSRRETRHLLARATERGLGLRRGEGFGRCLVDLPLHGLGLDQTRDGRTRLIVDMPGGIATGLPPEPRSPRAIHPTNTVRRLSSTLRELIEGIPASDRAGLARLLTRTAQCEDWVASLDSIRQQREERNKKTKGTDRLLEHLIQQHAAFDRQHLDEIARQLVIRDAAERRQRG